jgi:hypothetical protein
MTTALENLRPGTRFRLVGPDGHQAIMGQLLDANDSFAAVRLDGPDINVEFVDCQGKTRTFWANRGNRSYWAPATLVDPICFTPLEDSDMATTARKTPKTKKLDAALARRTKAKATAKKDDKRTGEAPRSQLDLEETKKLEAARMKKAEAATPKKLSLIDAAARVIAAAKDPMNAKEMIEAITAKGLWSSPKGKTPHATLYSAILREIGVKGKDARFTKTERGKFAAQGAKP